MKNTRTTHDGARIYSRWLLACYDILIYRGLAPLVWRCDSRHFLDLYTKHMSTNHADIGVGTGYFLNQCAYLPEEVRIGLFDLQPNCLTFTANRLARFQPETIQCNAVEPIHYQGERFDSIALGGILHCIPGDMKEKAVVFDVIQSIMSPASQVFGYTILNQEIHKTRLSRFVYALLHYLKVINGDKDSASQLYLELSKRFKHVNVRIIGCIALFDAREILHN